MAKKSRAQRLLENKRRQNAIKAGHLDEYGRSRNIWATKKRPAQILSSYGTQTEAGEHAAISRESDKQPWYSGITRFVRDVAPVVGLVGLIAGAGWGVTVLQDRYIKQKVQQATCERIEEAIEYYGWESTERSKNTSRPKLPSYCEEKKSRTYNARRGLF